MTRNDIIDIMLAVVGESGVSSANTTNPSVQTALRIFNTEDIAFQSRGWWFNTEYGLKLVQDDKGRVIVPADTLELQLTNVSNLSALGKLQYVRRGGFIYDTQKHTNVLNTSIIVDVVFRLAPEDMSGLASVFLMRKCAEEMYIDDDGDTFKTNKLEQKRMEAWQALKAKEMSTLAINAADRPEVQTLLNRMQRGFTIGNPNIIGGGRGF